jgi:amino acid transporter
MRWFGFAVALIALLVVVEATIGRALTPAVLALAEALVLSFFVVSCGVAILRYRLYDIDRIITRSTSYTLVTAFVVVVYLGVVAAASTVIPVSETLPVALATLVAAALFRPALRWVRTRVDRRFDRARFDSEKMVHAFSERLAREVDASVVTDELLEVLNKTVQPSSVGLWVIGGRS